MNNEPFHPIGQEWRYFSREKSIIHTLHLAQLPTGTVGDTILIDTTPPAAQGNGGSFSVPSLKLPLGGGPGVENVTFTRNTLSTCFGSVGVNRTILAQMNMDIQFVDWTPQIKRIYFIPKQSGWFMVHIEAQSDNRDINYLGPVDPDTTPPVVQAQYIRARISKLPVTAILGETASAIVMNGLFDGTHWNSGFYIACTHVARLTIFVRAAVGQPIVLSGQLLGNEPDAYTSGYVLKIAE